MIQPGDRVRRRPYTLAAHIVKKTRLGGRVSTLCAPDAAFTPHPDNPTLPLCARCARATKEDPR